MQINRKKLLDEIENSVPVLNWNYMGIKIWPLIRLIMSFEILKITKTQGINAPSQRKITQFLNKVLSPIRIWIAKFRDFRQNTQDLNSNILLLGRSTARNTKIDGKWVDPILDSFKYYLHKINLPSIHMEFDSLNIVRIPRFSSSVFIHNSITFCKIKALIKSKLSKNLSMNLPGFEQFTQILSSNNLYLSVINKNKIRYYVVLLRYRADLFKKYLKKYKIKLGFCSVYYIPETLAFILACNEMQIPSIDIQHGVQGDTHIAYSDWKDAHSYKLLPRFFWVWSQHEKTTIEKWSGNEGPKSFVGGNLWMQFWRDKLNPHIKNLQTEIQKTKVNSSCDSYILYSVQPNDSFEIILPLIKDSPKNWHWWIRLHPRMLEQESQFRALLEKNSIENYCIEEASQMPLPLLLSNLDIHVTFNSSVVVEAEEFNMPSLVIAENGQELFPRQFQDGEK